MATPDPQPTEQSQGSNLHPHGFWFVSTVPRQELPCLFFFFFFFFGHTCSIWKYPGHELNPSCSCNLQHSWGNAGSLTHCARLRIEPGTPRYNTARYLTCCATAGIPAVCLSDDRHFDTCEVIISLWFLICIFLMVSGLVDFPCTCWPSLCLLWEKRSSVLFLSDVLFCFVCFLGLHPQHIAVPWLGVESELQLPTYTTATATWDLSCICSLYHGSRQCGVPDLLSKTRDQTRILVDTSQILFCWATIGTPFFFFFFNVEFYEFFVYFEY